MKRTLSVLAATGLAAAALALTGGAASAAHCADAGLPGHSDFAAHVKATNGPGGHNEGDHKGWSTCR